MIRELRNFPGCFDEPTNSFNLDKIADWVIRNLENYRQSQISGAPTASLGENPILDEAVELPPHGTPPPTRPRAVPSSEGTLSNPRTLHAPPVSVPGGPARPPSTRVPPATPPTTTPRRPQSGRAPGASAGSGAFPAASRPPSERTGSRLLELTRRAHELNKEVTRLQGEVKLYQESWVMLAQTMGLPTAGETVAEVVIEGVANLESLLDQTQEERDDLREQVDSLSNAPPQDLVKILESFPTDVIQTLGPDRVGEDLAGRIQRAVEALSAKSALGVGKAAKLREGVEKRARELESAEARLREELTWMTAERERARKERDESEVRAKKFEEKSAASLKMLENFRKKVVALEGELVKARGGEATAAPEGVTGAAAERDRLWEVLGELVGAVSGTVGQLGEIQAALEKLPHRSSVAEGPPPEPEVKEGAVEQPLLADEPPVGPYASEEESSSSEEEGLPSSEEEGSSSSEEEEVSSQDKQADEIHAK